ncbi:MAG TPA: hypothetical protein VFH51_10155, partial [Myxococcota bacterium]|nr:hypothetical protein [Myxococcota bacterium]
SVAHFGRCFADFLGNSEGAPHLAALATLEWARRCAFTAPDEPAAAGAALATHPRQPEARLRFVQALRVCELTHDILALWREEAAVAPAMATPVAVWRRGFEVVHAPLGPWEAEALRLARAREPLATVCSAFAAAPEPVPAAFAVLASWFADGWVAAVL